MGDGLASNGQVGKDWGLTRLQQLSRSPLWQQSKLWLGRRLPVFVSPVLRLSRISLSKSSSSPDPRKLLSRAASAHESWTSSGLTGVVLREDGEPQISAQGPQSSGSGRFGIWGPSSPSVLASHFQHCPLPLPLSLTLPPGTQKVFLPVGVSCWGEGAGSAKDRFGGWASGAMKSGGCVKEGECEVDISYWGTRGRRQDV